MWCSTITLAALLAVAIAQKKLHYVGNRTTMVHLFEWKFKDIAEECEKFLGPMGYGGVQVSPVNENFEIENRPWYERYQPMSYKIITRSGNEEEFKDMVRRCNKVGVRIYVDVVFNHMSGNISPAVGTGGSTASPENFEYPAVSYGRSNFHKPCAINNYNDPVNVRDCELSGLHDLDQSQPFVRRKIIEFLNRLIDAGVAGLRVDAAKHMWPADLKAIYNGTDNLNPDAGFGANQRPTFYQEVIDLGSEAVKKTEYNDIGMVIEFQYGCAVGSVFGNNSDRLARLSNLGPDWNLLPSNDALVMIDNHDNQRGHGAGGTCTLTHKTPRIYKMAVAFMLAHPYGWTRVMSSYYFDDPSVGPPADSQGNIVSPKFDSNGQCANGWVCEHRWPQIYHMVQFRNAVEKEQLTNWWSNGKNQIAFSRGAKGFVAFNKDDVVLQENLQTGLPAGTYCDVISGALVNGKCTGNAVKVNENGIAAVNIPANSGNGVLAIHVEAKL